jgi:quinol monooxygenase YgiN
MAIGVYFSPESVNTQQYGEVLKQLNAAGANSPKGRSYHSAFGPPDHLMVFEVWDSQADFDAFGAILMPILSKNGINPGQPDIMPVHNVIKG